MPRTSRALTISISVIVLCVFGLFAFISLFASETSDGDNGSSMPSEPLPPVVACCEPTSHVLVGSYSLEDNFTAKLLLNNKGGQPLEVQPILYDFHGQELQLASVTVPAQGFQFFDIREWAGVGGESFKKGEIKLLHGGVDLVLGAQIYFTDEVHSLTFEERLQELGKFNSQKQEAIWWMPSNQAQVQVIMTNTTDAALTVTARLTRKPHKTGDPQTFVFTPHETKVLDLRQDFNDGNQFTHSDLIALSLEHTATAADALSARI